MKVNMTPNPLDVVTIHASQGDTEARQWEFELHNNGELIDTSEVTEQMVFKSYKGGTEQILPENGAVPVTAPFVGDIKYPDTTRNDQEFLYRQSPTEEDGLAKITDIKGNTLVWNQLVQNGNFADKSNWIEANATLTVNNNIATMVASATYGNIEQILSVKANHMYFATCDIKLTTVTNFNLIQFRPYVGVSIPCASTTEWQTLSGLFIPTTSAAVYYPRITDARASGWDAIQIRNCMVIDLTQMGLDITDPSEFTSLFPLSYYSYNQGTLLSFNGNGIKTVGKNLLNPSFTTIDAYINRSGVITESSNDKSVIVPLLPNLSYVFTWNRGEIISSVADDTQVGLYNEYPSIGVRGVLSGNTSVSGGNIRFNSASNRYAVIKISNITRTDFDSTIIGSQLEFGTSATSYEPYTSSTLSLPVSTYFPNGMASAKNANNNAIVYDELTPNKAIKRLEQYTFTGNERISGITNLGTYYRCFFALPIPSKGTYATIWEKNVPNVYNYTDDSSHYYVQNSQFWYFTTSSTEQAIRDELNGTKFYYDLATPTETSLTTASLVTENAEIPLSNEDGTLIGKCTEQLSENPGFIDAKIKLADDDGECYSNKIQLHVERSPQ